MPTFKAPQYTKTTNPKTGAQEPCYTFPIEFTPNEDTLSFLIDSTSDITLQNLNKCVIENVEWWNTFVNEFLKNTTKFFTKPYTVEQINKISKHTLNGSVSVKEFPAEVKLMPKTIQISGGVFMTNWTYTVERVVIEIPVFDEPDINAMKLNELPVSNQNEIVENLEELNIDEMPSGGDSTDALQLYSPAKFFEKQRVKEARLKAKLAVYKAQRQMALYYEKYGDDISDSDSDLESSDDETDEESGDEEEVQL
jgi:hypothetical protein